MDFKRARNKEQFAEREAEILRSAMAIYEEFGFEEVTFSRISQNTNFTRPTIYSYYKTKEEIMLCLTSIYLDKFVQLFSKKMGGVFQRDDLFTATAMCECFEEVPEFIHLYTVIYSIIEKNVSLEALAQFKRDTMSHLNLLSDTMKKISPDASDEEIYTFLLRTLCFASGLCPMTEQSDVQREAVRLSETGYVAPVFKQIFISTLLIFLKEI